MNAEPAQVLPEKKNPAAKDEFDMRGLFEHPSSSPRERLALQGKGRRSLLRCPHFKCHIESDDCLLDPRLIDPFFSAMPRPAIGEGAGALNSRD